MNTAQKALTEDRKIILVVDDDGNINSFVTDMLSGAGYDVVTAYNWRSAMSAMNNLMPDLLILDVMLPAACGEDKCGEIMSYAQTKNIPVIMMSGFNAQPIASDSYLAEASQFIYKSDLGRILIKEIDNILK